MGQGNPFAPRHKEWIATAIGAGVSLASSLIGGNKAAKAAREAERRQRARDAEEEAWYNRRYNEDYLDTAAGQNLVNRAKALANEQWKRAAGAQAVAGGTDAAVAQAKEAGNRMLGDTMSNIAATDQARKANVDALHRQAQEQSAQQDIARAQQKANNITQAAQGASNAIMSAAGALEQGTSTPSNLAGGGNNSQHVRDLQTSINADTAMSAMKSNVEADKKRLFGG